MALWREALLAKAVLQGRTRGYRHHPQLDRFRACARPRSAINAYLSAIHAEAMARGYAFDRSKVGRSSGRTSLVSTHGQLRYEWRHLMRKLRARSPRMHAKWTKIGKPEPHPLFALVRGGIEEWEKL